MAWAGAAAAMIIFILVPAFFSPQSETIWAVYETRGDLIRLALGFAGFAVCVWIVIRLFRSRPSVPSRSSAPTWGMAASSRLSEFLSSLTPRTLAWSATTVVAISLPTAVITAFVVKEQVAPRGEQHARARTHIQYLSDEEVAAIVAGGRQLMITGDIPNARLVLQQAAEAGNATAALELGATYDPTQKAQIDPNEKASVPAVAPNMANIRMARLWYEKARDRGSAEAARRLERLAGHESQPR